jgi:uncharacterized protein (DUF2141 family)
MAKRFLISLIFLAILVDMQAQASLQVTVQNVSSSKGKVLFALFNQENGFPGNAKKAFLIRETASVKGSVKIAFDNIPAGTYALSVFHDANNDGELNTNLLGIPKEDYGFSNNARPGYRAPTFKEAAFRFEKSSAISVTIK